MKNIFSRMVIFASIFISFSTSALEMKMKTFHKAAVDTDIVATPISGHSVTSVIQCVMSCNTDLHCESFTICQQDERKLICKLFAQNVWATGEKRYAPSCSFYRENDFCKIVTKIRINFLESLGISMQQLLQIKYPCQERRPQKAKMLEILPKVSKSWIVAFDVKPIGLVIGWTSILHLSIGNNIGSHGDRIPAIFFKSNSTKLSIGSSINDNINSVTLTTQELALNLWTQVIVMQNKNKAGEYIFRVFVNMEEIRAVQNYNAQEFENVKVWMGNPWHNAPNAEVRNLLYSNLE